MPAEMSRREFVRLAACAAVAVATGTAVGCAPSGDGTLVEAPSWSFGEETAVPKRVLVGYATRTGSTVGVAEEVGRTLAERGFAVDVKPLRERPLLDGYDACVVGSAINGGAWLAEAIGWVESHATALGTMPFAAFCVHGMNGGDDARQTRRRQAYLGGVRAVVTPVADGFFLGKGPTAEDTPLVARWAFKAFGGTTAEGDARDWDTIRAWAREVHL